MKKSTAGKSLGLKLEFLDLQTSPAIDAAFAAATSRADAVLILNSPSLNSHRQRMAELGVKSRLPTIYWATEFVEASGLMTYGVSFTDLYRRAATYVDKILKGRKAAELPMEQPRKFEFIANLKAAKTNRANHSTQCAGTGRQSNPLGHSINHLV